jgi:hypothetical protein
MKPAQAVTIITSKTVMVLKALSKERGGFWHTCNVKFLGAWPHPKSLGFQVSYQIFYSSWLCLNCQYISVMVLGLPASLSSWNPTSFCFCDCALILNASFYRDCYNSVIYTKAVISLLCICSSLLEMSAPPFRLQYKGVWQHHPNTELQTQARSSSASPHTTSKDGCFIITPTA